MAKFRKQVVFGLNVVRCYLTVLPCLPPLPIPSWHIFIATTRESGGGGDTQRIPVVVIAPENLMKRAKIKIKSANSLKNFAYSFHSLLLSFSQRFASNVYPSPSPLLSVPPPPVSVVAAAWLLLSCCRGSSSSSDASARGSSREARNKSLNGFNMFSAQVSLRAALQLCPHHLPPLPSRQPSSVFRLVCRLSSVPSVCDLYMLNNLLVEKFTISFSSPLKWFYHVCWLHLKWS